MTAMEQEQGSATTRSPYRTYTRNLYLDAGWTDVMPIIPKKDDEVAKQSGYAKNPPPVGFTGAGAKTPTELDHRRWMRKIGELDWLPDAFANIALHIHAEIVGIDVDEYGAKHGSGTLAQLEDELGALPETWRSSNRGKDPASGGHLFFRITPAQSKLSWPGKFGPGLDTLQSVHRYSIVWPSVHPKTGKRYRWYAPGGALVKAGIVPAMSDIPFLPKAWVEYATKGKDRAEYAKQGISSSAVAEWIDSRPKAVHEPKVGGVAPCLVLRNAVDRVCDNFAGGHPVVNDGIWEIIRLSAEGHSGLREALDDLRVNWYHESSDGKTHGTRGAREFAGEWRRMVEPGVDKVKGDLKGAELDECNCAAASEWSAKYAADEDAVKMRAWDDLGNADRMCDYFGNRIAWVDKAGLWFTFNGKKWESSSNDTNLRQFARKTLELAEEHEAAMYDMSAPETEEGETAKRGKARGSQYDEFMQWLKSQRSSAAITNMIKEFRPKPEIQKTIADFDQHPFLFNVANGTIDLRTGELREHDADDLITQMSGVEFDEEAEHPLWTKFLTRVQPDADVRSYLARVIGYSLTGTNEEEALFIHHGANGMNGKSVFTHVMNALCGDYFQAMDKKVIMEGKDDPHPTGLARMVGRRFLSASETKKGVNLSVDAVKAISSGDVMTARFMGKDFFDFTPVGKMHLMTNHEPGLSGAGSAIGRRLHNISWTVVIPAEEAQKGLAGTICRTELPGILNWALAGCREWRAGSSGGVRFIGLGQPESVQAATKKHIDESDPLAEWLRECCVFDPKAVKVDRRDLYRAYRTFCDDDMRPMSSRAFGSAILERGAKDDGQHVDTRRVVVRGLRLRTEEEMKTGKLKVVRTRNRRA